MIKKKEWKEFRTTGLLLYINQILHVFGWAIVVQNDDNGKFEEAYPAKVKFRGFTEKAITKAYKKMTYYMKDSIDSLVKDIDEE